MKPAIITLTTTICVLAFTPWHGLLIAASVALILTTLTHQLTTSPNNPRRAQ